MTVITNWSGQMMSKLTQKVETMFMMQIVDKITPNIETEMNVSDFMETSMPPLVAVKKRIVLKKSDVYAVYKRRCPIAKLVNDAIKQLNEGSGSSVKSIKCLIISKNPNMDERLLGIQVKRYIKKSLMNGTMIRLKRSFKLKKKYGATLKECTKEREKIRKQEIMKKLKEKGKATKVGNIFNTPESDKTNEKTMAFNDEKKPVQCPSLIDDKDKSNKKPQPDKKVSEISKPAGGKPTKTPLKKVKAKKKVRKVINLTLRPNPPHPKSVKKANVMSVVSNMKIRKLQQPMERARQNGAVR